MAASMTRRFIRGLGRFVLGCLVGFAVLRIVLGVLHAEPAPAWPPINKVAVPVKVTTVKPKCLQMGFHPCVTVTVTAPKPAKPTVASLLRPFRALQDALRRP